MPQRRFYVVAAHGDDEVELLKIEQAPARTVIASSLVGSMAGTSNIHVTHHEPKDGHAGRAIHISDERGTRGFIQLDPSTPVAHLATMSVDLRGLLWPPDRPFARTAYAEKWRFDTDTEGELVMAHVYYGEPAAVVAGMDAFVASPSIPIVYPAANGFAPVPRGHQIRFSRLVFDDAADPTVGCLLLGFDQPPEAPADPGERPTGTPLGGFSWVAYGEDGQIAEGTIEAQGTGPPQTPTDN